MSEPTLAEAMRRLDDVAKSVERIVATLETHYVRLDVYTAKHESIRRELDSTALNLAGDFKDLRDNDIKELKEARKADLAYKRQISAGVAVGLILMVGNVVFTTVNYLARATGG